jgi:hypothetical protein
MEVKRKKKAVKSDTKRHGTNDIRMRTRNEGGL